MPDLKPDSPSTSQVPIVEALTNRDREHIALLESALESHMEAFQAYVDWWGAIHSEDCPGDDTCAEGCDGFEINATVEKSFRDVSTILSEEFRYGSTPSRRTTPNPSRRGTQENDR